MHELLASHLFSSFLFYHLGFVFSGMRSSANEKQIVETNTKKINTLLFLQYCVSLISVFRRFVRSFRFIFTLFIHKSEHESILYLPIILLTPSYRHHKSKIFFNKSKWNTRQEAGQSKIWSPESFAWAQRAYKHNRNAFHLAMNANAPLLCYAVTICDCFFI